MRRWTARILSSVALVAAPVGAAAPALAVGPPAVDSRLLPEPGPAAPRHPTEQSDACVAPTVAQSRRHETGPDIQTAWTRTRGTGQTVAVIDTGVARHRLLPRLVPGGDYVAAGDGTADCDGHGTIVAGIIGAAPDAVTGFSGIAPDAAILGIRQSSIKFRTVDAPGSGVGDVDSLAAAVRSAADQGATVINISSVACLDAADALDDRALGAALAYAVDVRNTVIIAAAGNVGGQGTCPKQNPPPDPVRPGQPDWDGVDVVASPSWYDQYVLTVGSVNSDGMPSDFTLAGPWVDVAAVGEAVTSLSISGEGLVTTMPGQPDSQPISGTSYAAPVVSGIAALVRAVAPQLTARQVMHRIESTARNPASGWDPLVGHGVVDVLAAMHGVAGPASADTPQRVEQPPAAATDDGPDRFALIGAAACVALALSSILVPAVRSRRRPDSTPDDDAVPQDRSTLDAELGPTR